MKDKHVKFANDETVRRKSYKTCSFLIHFITCKGSTIIISTANVPCSKLNAEFLFFLVLFLNVFVIYTMVLFFFPFGNYGIEIDHQHKRRLVELGVDKIH